MRGALAVLAGVLLPACSPGIPQGVYHCDTAGDCPESWACVDGLCYRSARDAGLPPVDSGPCVPTTCDDARANCGEIDDGCGGTLDCGECAGDDSCGGEGIPNVCGCRPRGCEDHECGEVDDGCGGTLDCGGCTGHDTCDGATNRCGCEPRTTCAMGECGEAPDGCGGFLTCPGCPMDEFCGPDNTCSTDPCDPRTVADCEPDECGTVSDDCGGTIDCGGCTGSDTCGGGGIPNRCGCTPESCGTLGYECESWPDGCDGGLTCGTCTAPTTCMGGVCGCAPRSCDPTECGTVDNGCGGTMTCSCGSSLTCNPSAGLCVCSSPDMAEPNDTHPGAHDLGTVRKADGVSEWGDFNVHAAGNDDWYHVDAGVGTELMNGAVVQLRNVPSGSNYDLVVYADCEGSSFGDRVCDEGTAVDDAVGLGCASRSTGSADELVRLRLPSCPTPFLLVKVEPVTWAATCAAYRLTVDITP